MRRYSKFFVQLVVVILAVVAASLAEAPGMTPTEWVNVAILAMGAASVYCATNLPAGIWAYTKTIFAAGFAALTALSSVMTDGVSATEWWQILAAVLGALGVLAAPPSGVMRTAASSNGG